MENIYVVMNHFRAFEFGETTEAALTTLGDVVQKLDWALGLAVWSKFSDYEPHVSHKPQVHFFRDLCRE